MPSKKSLIFSLIIGLFITTSIIITSVISYSHEVDIEELTTKIIDKFGNESPIQKEEGQEGDNVPSDIANGEKEEGNIELGQDQTQDQEKKPEPKSKPEPNPENENAVIFSLARNSDLKGMIESIKFFETRFNKNYHYPWYFANNEPFSEEFQEKVSELVSGETKFITIPEEYWSYPDSIDMDKVKTSRMKATADGIMYGSSESYRHMCRFNSGFFYKLKELSEFDYYWRVEPDVKFKCDINYDVFKTMKNEGKMYGFNMGLAEDERTIPTLWSNVKEFMKKNEKLISKPNNMKFLSDDDGATYNKCHFWSNFEIGDFKFFRSEAYEKFFQFLDAKGGFFYERWGDAPVHTIATALLLPPEKLHFVPYTGYYHVPNQDCPRDEAKRNELNCNCNPMKDFTWHKWSCINKYFEVNELEKLNAGIEKRDTIFESMDESQLLHYLYGENLV